MSIPEGFSDPGTVAIVTALGENPLGGSVFEKQAIHEGDDQWREDHQAIVQVSSETGSVRLVDAADLPTFYTSIRLAPLTIMISLAFGIIGPIHTELLKLRICEVKLNISEDICQHISDIQYKELANSVVKETAEFQLYSNLISSLPPIIFSLFVGSWSDAYGRKPPMVLSLVGMTASAIYISILANYNLHPAYLFVAPVLSSMTGGWTILLMGMFSFIGDYTTDKNRGMNIAVVDGLIIVFMNAGSLAGGYVYKVYGMAVPFYLTVGCYVLALLHTAFFLHDRLRHTTGRPTSRGYTRLFSLNNFLDSFRMLRRERVGDTRSHIALLLFCLLLITTVSIGDGNVTQLLVEFQPFNWTVTFYTVFSCVSGLLSASSMMAAMILFRQYLGMPDTLIGMLAVLSAMLYYFGFGIAQVDWVLYISVVAGLLRNIMIPCLRSLLSGLVDRDEIGKIMSFISSCQSVTPLFASVIFTSMFAATSSWWPGLCFVVGAFVLVPVLACLAYVDVARRQEIYEKDPSLFRPDSQQSD